ncbi:MAG: hypothetical protein A3E82_05325 [Gammaproteobacteria bacterium RIFCSPHIGHO2_12_FULL_38_11]|nr:MAG: hypothetical protein A3E82_05325 [Gammaproteobacteria bacterium RIFCSPHIGHO2_12_FULL_38_11]
MSHDCTHDHGTNSKNKADFWTNTTAVIGTLAGLASVFFSVIRTVDTAANIDESKGLTYSYWGLGIAIAMAIFCTTGSTYCHITLNTLHQHDHADDTAPITVVSTAHTEIQTAATLLIPNNNERTAINFLQKILLLGDLLGHTCEISTPLLAVIILFNLNQLEKIMATSACLFVGVFGSIANVRTCYQALKKQNTSEAECDHGRSTRSASLITVQ